TAIVKIDGVSDPGLAAELEANASAVDLGVLVAHGREADRVVRPRVFLVADADQRFLEQLDDRRKDLLTGQAGVLQVRRRSLADPRQGLGERDQTAVLDL